jgi:hypothetical protein
MTRDPTPNVAMEPDLALSGICARYLVEELRLADFEVIRRPTVRFRD